MSDDIIFNSRAGVNVLDKFSVDMADRSVLPIEQGSTVGWVPGSSTSPGIDRFRVDVHEFSTAVPFHVRRVKLAALESAAGNYTIRWTASESGTVTLYRDTDRDPSSGLTQIGSTSASAGAGSFDWAVNAPAGAHYIYAVINDGSGNSNAAYSRWPIISDRWPPTAVGASERSNTSVATSERFDILSSRMSLRSARCESDSMGEAWNRQPAGCEGTQASSLKRLRG